MSESNDNIMQVIFKQGQNLTDSVAKRPGTLYFDTAQETIFMDTINNNRIAFKGKSHLITNEAENYENYNNYKGNALGEYSIAAIGGTACGENAIASGLKSYANGFSAKVFAPLAIANGQYSTNFATGNLSQLLSQTPITITKVIRITGGTQTIEDNFWSEFNVGDTISYKYNNQIYESKIYGRDVNDVIIAYNSKFSDDSPFIFIQSDNSQQWTIHPLSEYFFITSKTLSNDEKILYLPSRQITIELEQPIGSFYTQFNAYTKNFGNTPDEIIDASAWPYSSITFGDYSTAFGYCTVANSDYTTVLGKYNIGYDDSLLEIGNGTSDANRNNILTIDKNNGDISFNIETADSYSNSSYQTYNVNILPHKRTATNIINSNNQSLTDECALRFETIRRSSSQEYDSQIERLRCIFGIRRVDGQPITTGSVSDSGYLLKTMGGGNGGYLFGTWKYQSINSQQTNSSTAEEIATIGSSDLRLKQNIISFNNNYDTFFDQLSPIKYELKNDTQHNIHFGFIAQQVKENFENNISTTSPFSAIHEPNEDNEYYALDYREFIALNTDQIQKLKTRVATLEEQVASLIQQLNQR